MGDVEGGGQSQEGVSVKAQACGHLCPEIDEDHRETRIWEGVGLELAGGEAPKSIGVQHSVWSGRECVDTVGIRGTELDHKKLLNSQLCST